MATGSSGRKRPFLVAAVALAVFGFALFVVVFLVLTGIIAEPETVIESIARLILGE